MDTEWAQALSIRFFTVWRLKAFYVQEPPVEVDDPVVSTRPLLQDVKHSKKVMRRSGNCFARWKKANRAACRQAALEFRHSARNEH